MSSDCPSIKHDRRECVTDCSGKKECGCVIADVSKSEKKKRKTKTFPCDIPCSPDKAIKMLKVRREANDHTYDCKPWIDNSVTYDPLKAFEKCAKPPCLANLPPCKGDCLPKNCRRCYSSSSSSSSSSDEEIHIKIPRRKVCPTCPKKKCKSSSSSSSSD